MIDRRVLLSTAAGLAAGWLSFSGKAQAGEKPAGKFPVEKTPEEWKRQLTPAQYHILREEGTERTFTSPLLDEHRAGVFKCMGCGLELFRSEWKFDSGTGWPSFFRSIETNLATKDVDIALGAYREVHCAQCLGHQGHVFTDGPRPTGLRYCIDGVALTFTPT